MTELELKKQRLAELEEVLHKRLVQGQVASVGSLNQSASFFQTPITELEKKITILKNEIAVAEGLPTSNRFFRPGHFG